jgi:hypothetical protein
MAVIFGKRTKGMGIVLLACALFLLAIGYRDIRRLQRERAELGEAYNMLLSSDLYSPRLSPIWRPTCLLFGVLGLATIGSAMIDRRELRQANETWVRITSSTKAWSECIPPVR